MSEALDIGYAEYIDSPGICLMEWPEKIEELIPENALRVHITEDADGSRTVSFDLDKVNHA